MGSLNNTDALFIFPPSYSHMWQCATPAPPCQSQIRFQPTTACAYIYWSLAWPSLAIPLMDTRCNSHISLISAIGLPHFCRTSISRLTSLAPQKPTGVATYLNRRNVASHPMAIDIPLAHAVPASSRPFSPTRAYLSIDYPSHFSRGMPARAINHRQLIAIGAAMFCRASKL